MAELPQESVPNELQAEANIKEEPTLIEKIPLPDATLTRCRSQRRKGLVQFFAACFSLFVVGWGDGSSGPLLPRIQAEYDVRIQYFQASSKPSLGWLYYRLTDLCPERCGMYTYMALQATVQRLSTYPDPVRDVSYHPSQTYT